MLGCLGGRLGLPLFGRSKLSPSAGKSKLLCCHSQAIARAVPEPFRNVTTGSMSKSEPLRQSTPRRASPLMPLPAKPPPTNPPPHVDVTARVPSEKRAAVHRATDSLSNAQRAARNTALFTVIAFCSQLPKQATVQCATPAPPMLLRAGTIPTFATIPAAHLKTRNAF